MGFTTLGFTAHGGGMFPTRVCQCLDDENDGDADDGDDDDDDDDGGCGHRNDGDYSMIMAMIRHFK